MRDPQPCLGSSDRTSACPTHTHAGHLVHRLPTSRSFVHCNLHPRYGSGQRRTRAPGRFICRARTHQRFGTSWFSADGSRVDVGREPKRRADAMHRDARKRYGWYFHALRRARFTVWRSFFFFLIFVPKSTAFMHARWLYTDDRRTMLWAYVCGRENREKS